jgi:hypothetical protein
MFDRNNGFLGLLLDAAIIGTAYYMGKKETEKQVTENIKELCQKHEINELKRQVAELKRMQSIS